MQKDTVIGANFLFFINTVHASLVIDSFAQAVLGGSSREFRFSTDIIGEPGYIKIDSSAVRQRENNSWSVFADEIKKVLHGIAFLFAHDMIVEGDLAEKVNLQKDGYKFSFHIKQYERDSEHQFQNINPEDLKKIPESEKLGRVVYLKIAPC